MKVLWSTEVKYHLQEINYHSKCFREAIEEAIRHKEKISQHKAEATKHMYDFMEPPAEDPKLMDQYCMWLVEEDLYDKEDCNCDLDEDRLCECMTFDAWLDEIYNRFNDEVSL